MVCRDLLKGPFCGGLLERLLQLLDLLVEVADLLLRARRELAHGQGDIAADCLLRRPRDGLLGPQLALQQVNLRGKVSVLIFSEVGDL